MRSTKFFQSNKKKSKPTKKYRRISTNTLLPRLDCATLRTIVSSASRHPPNLPKMEENSGFGHPIGMKKQKWKPMTSSFAFVIPAGKKTYTAMREFSKSYIILLFPTHTTLTSIDINTSPPYILFVYYLYYYKKSRNYKFYYCRSETRYSESEGYNALIISTIV